MKLKNMQITADEQRERDESNKIDCAPSSGRSYSARYPYGLEIRLDNDAIEKLGLEDLPDVGKRVRIEAVGVITGAHINETRRGDKLEKNRSLEIQIQKLGVSKDPQSAVDAVDDALDELEA